MRILCKAVPFVLLTASYAFGQGAKIDAPATAADAKPAEATIYTIGPGVIAPILLSAVNLSSIPDEKCKKKISGTIPISFYIDTEGVPQDMTLLFPKDSKLDELAIKTVAGDRFKPGTYQEQPVPVAESVVVTFNACKDEIKDDSGKRAIQLRLCSLPEQQFAQPQKSQFNHSDLMDTSAVENIGPGYSAPVPMKIVAPKFSDEARTAKYQGICVLSLVVDTEGMPRNIRVKRALGMGLDEKAIEAVKQYRFKPAIKDGKPVMVNVTVEVNFKLY
jgi:TonB family protein